MDYSTVKLIHQSTVALSGLGFLLRGAASLRGAGWPRGRLARTLPHAIDTVLLLSALTMAAMASLNPAHTPWLMAKILGLLVYIALGVVALRVHLDRRVRTAAWLAALLVFAWIGSVALLKSPFGFLQFLLPAIAA